MTSARPQILLCRECSKAVEVLGTPVTRICCPACMLWIRRQLVNELFICEGNVYAHLPGAHDMPRDAPLLKVTQLDTGRAVRTYRLLCLGVPPSWATNYLKPIAIEQAADGELPGLVR